MLDHFMKTHSLLLLDLKLNQNIGILYIAMVCTHKLTSCYKVYLIHSKQGHDALCQQN